MAIGSPDFQTVMLLGTFIIMAIVLAIVYWNQDCFAFKVTRRKKKSMSLFGVIIFIVVISSFITSSGCIINNNVNQQTQKLNQTPTQILTSAEISITYPTDSATVKILETITGTAKNIPEGQKLWIAIYPHTAFKYYPQNPVSVESNGSWMLPVQFGEENHIGEKFDIVAILADKNAQNELNTYIDKCIDYNFWPGMRALPDGSTIYTRVTVTREPAEITSLEPSTLVSPSIKITYPLDSSTVNIQENVTGTAKSVPEGDEIWVLVYPYVANKYYPQNKVSIRNEDWSVPIGIGTKENVGHKFEIISVLADQKAQDEFNAYLNTCKAVNEWPGMDSIPNSVKVYDKVTVIRV